MIEEDISFHPDKINLKKRFPYYINTWFFKFALIKIIILTLIVIYVNGAGGGGYIENPTNEIIINQYRTCQNLPYDNCVLNPPKELIKICGGDCPEYLEPYQIIGVKPKIEFNLYLIFVFSIAGWAFVANHLNYIYKHYILKPKTPPMCLNCGFERMRCNCGVKYDR